MTAHAGVCMIIIILSLSIAITYHCESQFSIVIVFTMLLLCSFLKLMFASNFPQNYVFGDTNNMSIFTGTAKFEKYNKGASRSIRQHKFSLVWLKYYYRAEFVLPGRNSPHIYQCQHLKIIRTCNVSF